MSADSDIQVFLITETDDEATGTMADGDALLPDVTVDMSGAFHIDGCFVADTIIGLP